MSPELETARQRLAEEQTSSCASPADIAFWESEVLRLSTVECMYPDPEAWGRERSDAPPEEYGEWRAPSGRCTHYYCLCADDARRTYKGAVAAGWISDHAKEAGTGTREWEI